MSRVARLSDLAEQIRGVSYAKQDASSEPRPGLLPVLRAGNIADGRLTFDDLVYVPSERISDRQLIQKNDVVIAASSGSLEVVGKAARALSSYSGGFGAFCKVLRPGNDVDPSYFAHFFQTHEYRRRISQLAAGANINNLRNGDLDDLDIPLLPLPEQRRIAAILDQADTLRAKRRAAIQKLDELTQSIFLDMFGDPATNPKGWPMKTLGALLTFQQYGPRFYNEAYADDGIRIVRITDLDESGVLRFVDMPRMLVSAEDEAKYRLHSGDLIFARTGATVGKVALIGPNDPPCIAGAYFIVMRFDPKRVAPGYALAVLMAPSVRAIVSRRSRQAAQQNFSGPGLRALPMPLPPIALQREFIHRLAGVDRVKKSHITSLTALETLFASLQHRAFQGEL